jgi:hypothetical protein
MDKTQTPPMEKSDEANKEQLQMAIDQGMAYKTALDHMANEEADDGGEVHIGDYLVAYAVESAEGMYHMQSGGLEWIEPGDENCHIEISVRDAADQRFIPYLDITVEVLEADGNSLGSHTQPFVWHPWLYHYGRNWQVPGDGEYTLKVSIKAPDFPRHDEKNGERYGDDVNVKFEGVRINAGQK